MEGLNYLDLTFWALGGNTHWPESRGTLLYLFYAIPVIMQGKHGKSHPDKNLGSNGDANSYGNTLETRQVNVMLALNCLVRGLLRSPALWDKQNKLSGTVME